MRRRRAFGLLLAAAATPALGQGHPPLPEGPPAEQGELRAELVRTGLYLIAGGGCNSLLRLSAAGCVLVDGKLPGAYRALMSQVRRINRIADLALRVVVYTNGREAHAGNHARFAGERIAVLSQARALPRFAQVAASTGQPATAHVFGVESSHAFRIGGVEIGLHHFGAAKTDNDLVVHFPDLRVVALGDILAPAGPVPDAAAGGSLLGWGTALERVLELDFDLAVPSDGPVVTRTDVAGFHQRVDALLARATAYVKAQQPPGRLREHLSASDLDWVGQWDDDSLRRLYAELQNVL